MNYRWRIVDIIVAAVLAVTFGVIFWAWGLLWFGPFSVAFSGFAPAAGVVTGLWFMPAALVPLIIRKPGAAFFAEAVAAVLSLTIGSGWGITVLWYGLAQGIAGEIAFAIFAYRRWGLPQALLAGGFAGAVAAYLDITYYYGDWATNWQWIYAALETASGVLITGIGSYLLVKALAQTGVLDRFPSGRARELV